MLFPEISTGSGLRSVMGTSFCLHKILILVQLGQVLMAYIFIFVRVEIRKPNVFVSGIQHLGHFSVNGSDGFWFFVHIFLAFV